MIVIGIDPGLTGAMAFVDTTTHQAEIDDIPTQELPGSGMVSRRIDGRKLAELVHRRIPVNRAVLVVCEAVHAMGGNSMQSMGSLLRSLGAIEAVFDVLRYPAALVTPQAWQRHYGLQGKKQPREKGALPKAIMTARGLYPNAVHQLQRVKDHNRAEALLIAHYGARTFG